MLLALDGVSKAYAAGSGVVTALSGIDVRLERGEFVLVTGASGAGKTTLLHLAGLLDHPTSGRVTFEGRDAAALRVPERAATRLARIGFVFQHYYLAPDLTVRENVALPALASGVAPDEAAARADALLDRVGLAPVAMRFPRELSGGEQQRAGVARALVNRPPLVLADEPTGNLDPESGDAVARLLAEAHEEGRTVLVATHDPERFPAATRRLRLAGGRLAEVTPAALP